MIVSSRQVQPGVLKVPQLLSKHAKYLQVKTNTRTYEHVGQEKLNSICSLCYFLPPSRITNTST